MSPLRISIMMAAASLGVAACEGAGGELDLCGEPTNENVTAALVRSQCGDALELEEINQYEGDFAHAQEREDAVALVNGTCSGTLVAGSNNRQWVLTAGHCVSLGDEPLVVFNHERCADGEEDAFMGTVVEQSLAPDFALIELDGAPNIAATELGADASERLAVIQHPSGRPKVIAEGFTLREQDGVLYYVELDTLAGGSGAGVLSWDGRLVAVHSDGDCGPDGGSNSGWTATAIANASRLLDNALGSPTEVNAAEPDRSSPTEVNAAEPDRSSPTEVNAAGQPDPVRGISSVQN